MTELSDHFPPLVSIPLKMVMKLMNIIIVFVGCLMSVTFFLVVIFRYGFNADLFAYEEWLMAACFWMFFMASAVATHNRLHVNADILGFMISDPVWTWRRAVVVEAIELLVAAFVTYWGFLMIQEAIAAYPNWQTTIALKIPFLVPRLGIFFGFLMMAVYNALHLYVMFKLGPDNPDLIADNADEEAMT